MDVGADTAERLCEITITEASEHVPDGFRLNLLFMDQDSLRLTKRYKQAEFDQILRALRRVDQFAKISEQNNENKNAFQDLVKYLEKERLVSPFIFLTFYILTAANPDDPRPCNNCFRSHC